MEFSELQLAIGSGYYVKARLPKTTQTFIDLKTLDNLGSRKNILGENQDKRFIEIDSTRTDQKTQRSQALSRPGFGGLRIYLPSKTQLTNKKTKQIHLVFPKKRINLIYIASALFKALDTTSLGKLKPYKKVYAFKVVGGGWHQIAEAEETLLDRIFAQEQVANEKKADREKTTENLNTEIPPVNND